MEDEKIIRLYWERNESAIRETEAKYGKYCYTVAYNILRSHEDSDECVNDTWHGAWNAMPPEKPNKLQCFLARITRNIAIDRYRYDGAQKRGAETEIVIDEYLECIPSGEISVEDEFMLKQAINGFLAKLNEEKRNIFVRRYWYLESTADIAERFAISESKVKTTLFRCRNQFREYLKKEGYLL